MKKVLMIAIMAVSVSFTAMAQEQNQNQEGRRFDRSEMIQRRTDMVAQRYGLDDKQKEQLLELNKKYSDVMPMGPMRGGRPGGDGQMRRQGPPPAGNGEGAQARPPRGGMGQGNGPGRGPGRFDPEKMKEYEEGLKSIMTPEQYEKYEADRKQRMERMPQRPNNNQ